MSPELLGAIMLVVMLGAIFLGFPIAFTLILLAFIFGWVGLGDKAFYIMVFQTIGLMKEEVLAAVPLFIFMGYLMEQGGLMDRLFRGFQLMMGPVPGSLYVGVLITATIFGIAAGTVGATVVLMGIMAVPIMTKAGYDIRMSAGAITAGGTLGILVPPSVMLVVMGPVMGVSVAELYASCFGPGFLLAGIFIAYTLIRSLINPRLGPPLPPEERIGSLKEIVIELTMGMLPHAVLIIATLGTIIWGWATPTEAAAMGVVGAAFLAVVYREFTWQRLKDAVYNTLLQVQHGPVPGRCVQRVWRRVLTAGDRDGSHQRTACLADSSGGDAGRRDGCHLPARMALRVAGRRPRLCAAAAADHRLDENRHAVVRHAHRREPPNGLPLAAGRDVGILSQGGGAELGAWGHLPGHGPVHGAPAHRPGALHHLPRHRPLVPALAVRQVRRVGPCDKRGVSGYNGHHRSCSCRSSMR